MSSGTHKVSISDLTKFYGEHLGIENLTLDITGGEIFGFLGPNGAGKTTTIRCIMNILVPNSGTIMIDGEEVSRNNTAIKEKIGYLPGELYFPKGFTVKDFIDYIDSLKQHPSARIQELVDRFKLDTTKKIQALSHGNKQKLGIILAFMHDPDLIILDEPTTGLDPLFQQELYNLLTEEKERGKTIFFSSHNLDEVQKICDRVAIIRKGQLINLEDVKNLSNTIPRKLKAMITDPDIQSLQELGLKFTQDGEEINILITKKEELAEVLELLTEMDVDDITYPPASLEEYFMLYYNGNGA
jgi:ABC-2 type transport system ATP-binding protein